MDTVEETIQKRVFPTKRDAVRTAVRIAESDPRIKRLFIFGSAVTDRCGASSDLDISLDVPDVDEDTFGRIARAFWLGIEGEVDIVRWNSIRSASLKREIESKGVELYARSS